MLSVVSIRLLPSLIHSCSVTHEPMFVLLFSSCLERALSFGLDRISDTLCTERDDGLFCEILYTVLILLVGGMSGAAAICRSLLQFMNRFVLLSL